VDLSGWVGVGLGGNCDCRCGILYVPMLGVGEWIMRDWLSDPIQYRVMASRSSDQVWSKGLDEGTYCK